VHQLRRLALSAAYGIVLLLAAVWISSALASLQQPLFDLGRARIGDAIIAFAGALALSPESTLKLAHMLVGVKLLLGAYLVASLVGAVYERLRWGASGDEMLDLGLFLSAIASIVAASPVLADAGALRAAVGELLLCAMASGLAAFGRGWRVPGTHVRSAASARA
jgi:cytochrome bd-type quinol oxidase subunit 1